MNKMPVYDVNDTEKAMIDKIPEIIGTKNAEKIIAELKKLYQIPSEPGYLSALLIIEKYLFRAYELLYFVGEPSEEFSFDEYFFDEAYHKKILTDAKKRLDTETAQAALEKGTACIRQNDYENATRCFKEAALGGSVGGAFEYGITVSRGEYCEQDPLLGAFWYWVAACNGNVKAMINLALCYRTGEGVCADGMNMLYWYGQAAIMGSADGAIAFGKSLQRNEVFNNLSSLGTFLIIRSLRIDEEEAAQEIREAVLSLCSNMEKYIYNRVF